MDKTGGEQVLHPMESESSSDALKYILERYNALSWLTADPGSNGNRRSCLPAHVCILLRLYRCLDLLHDLAGSSQFRNCVTPTKPAQQLKTVVTPEVQITNILGPRNDSQNSINLTNRKTNNNTAQNGNATTLSSNKQFNTSNQAPSQFQKNSVNSASTTGLTNNYPTQNGHASNTPYQQNSTSVNNAFIQQNSNQTQQAPAYQQPTKNNARYVNPQLSSFTR